MGSNQFGQVFRCITWGESHGKAIGVVIDGCPAGVNISEEEINKELRWRMPGESPFTSPRKEKDRAEILSGVFEGQTTGAPISIMIWNADAQSDSYEPIKDLLRPGHANFTYLEKYGIFDYRGGGRSSGRETACRVAAGAVAKKILSDHGISFCSYLSQVGEITEKVILSDDLSERRSTIQQSPVFCPSKELERKFIALIDEVKSNGDSIGGVVLAEAYGLPAGLGDPVYEKLEANLAKAMLSIPASKGFEIGLGFEAAKSKGSKHNDLFEKQEGKVQLKSNSSGGTLGGISNGCPLSIKVAFKPASSIAIPQQTLDSKGDIRLLELPKGSRHDPCVAIRAVPVVEAMMALVLVDALLMNRLAKREC